MKFSTRAPLALAVAPTLLLAPRKVHSQSVSNGNFTFVGSYGSSALGDYLGGGSIVNNTLLVIVNAALSDAFIASVPIQRDATTGKITGFEFENATVLHEEEYLEMLSESANFVDDQYIFTTDDDDYYPYTMSFADPTFTTISRIENIPALNLTDAATGDLFYGPYGVDFSPVIQDPGTGIGKIMCTSPYSFWEMGLELKSGSSNEWEIYNATKLADLDPQYPGGFSFIPSGSMKGNIFYSNWDDNIVKMMKFDSSGRPAGSVSHPEITDFITGIPRPWGFFFDPQTNDFFVSTYEAKDDVGVIRDGIVHFEGFVPGLDVGVVTKNIKNEMQLALTILLGGRRKLKLKVKIEADHKPKKYFRSLRNANANQAQGQGQGQGANPCDKANPNPNAAFGIFTAGKECAGKETEIPTADEIADELLQMNADKATQYFADQVEEIFTNDSFTTDVLAGADSATFDDNVAKLSDSIELIQDVATSAGLEQDDLDEVKEKLNQVKALVALLANVGEGA